MQYAQLVHAAGESSPGNIPPDTHAVVLSVPDESELLLYAQLLARHEIQHVLIREPDPPYSGQAMALGCYVEDRTRLKKLLARLPLVR